MCGWMEIEADRGSEGLHSVQDRNLRVLLLVLLQASRRHRASLGISAIFAWVRYLLPSFDFRENRTGTMAPPRTNAQLQRVPSADEGGSSKSVTFAAADTGAAPVAGGAAAAAPSGVTLKRKASSTLSALLSRLSSRYDSDEEGEPEESVTPGTFSRRLRKVLCIIGLSSSSDDQPVAQPVAQPSLSVLSVDEVLDALVDKAFPLEPPVLQQMSSLDLSKVVDLTQLERDVRLAAPEAVPVAMAVPVPAVPAVLAVPAAALAAPAAALAALAVPLIPAVPEVPAKPVQQEPLRLQSVNLLSRMLPTSLVIRGPAADPPSPGPSSLVPGAADAQAAPRSPTNDSEVRKDWSDLEDAEIVKGFAEFGQKWRAIAARLPGRSDDAVRNRWKRLEKAQRASDPGAPSEAHEAHKRPPRTAWSLEEDRTIVEMVERLGFKWGKIEQVLDGRTPHAIRNRFYRLQQQQQQQQQQQGQAGPSQAVPM